MSRFERRVERYPIVIGASDIDHMGHVNNSVYLRWVQEAVLAHWARVATPEAAARHLWVALRHEITYRRAAFAEDALMAITELRCLYGVRATYRTLIQRGDSILAEALSQWCSVDSRTGRPLRLCRLIADWLDAPREHDMTCDRRGRALQR